MGEFMSMDKFKDNDKVLKKDKKEVIITSRMLFLWWCFVVIYFLIGIINVYAKLCFA